MAERISIDTNSTARHPSIFYQHYKDHTPIGKGGFGTVFQATERYSGRRVAIKRVKLKIGTEQDVLEELQILSKLEHDNILRYHNSWVDPVEYHKERDKILFNQSIISVSYSSVTDDTSSRIGRTCDDNVNVRPLLTNDSDDLGIIFESPSSENQPVTSISKSSINDTTSSQNKQTEEKELKRSKSYEYLFIVTSLCKNESLEHRLLPEYRSINKINRFDALYIFYQIVKGVRYLHNKMYTDFVWIHCDLKPANILFSLDGDIVKIADFGLALTQQALVPIENDLNLNENKQAAGTRSYMPPSEEPLSFKRDIYALGIILFELLYPVSSRTERAEVLKNIGKRNIEFPVDFEEKYGNKILKSLINQLVSHSPNERPIISLLNETIRRILESDDSAENKDTIVSKIEYVLNNPVVKHIPLSTDEIQYGVYDTCDQYMLLSDDNRLKLYNINCELIDEYSGLHENSQYVGYVQRIVWCEYLRQFLILCRYFLYAFTPNEKAKLINMKKIYFIDRYRQNDDLRVITYTNKHIFINYSYHTIRQYDIPGWSLSREWSKKRLNYEEADEIRRTTCSTTNDYITFNVRLEKCKWVIDVRRIDDDLTLLKRIQIPGLGIKHKLQLSSREWLVSNEKNKFCVLDISDEESNLKTIQTNITSECDIYAGFFANYFIVPIVKTQHNAELNENNTIQRHGVIHFYQWK